jgi:hypothetical protein
MRPIVDGLQGDFGEDMTFIDVNALSGNGAQAFRQLRLPGHPSVVIFSSSSAEVYRAFGIVSIEQLRDAIEDHLDDS